MSLTSATISGRLTSDASLKYTNGGMPVCHFTIATSRRVKKGEQYVEEPSFWDCVLFGKQGENLNQYLTKGKGVVVSGEIYQQRWEKDGQQHMKVEINVSQFGFSSGESRKEGQGEARESQGEKSYAQSTGSPAARQEPRKAEAQKPSENDFSDDVPF